MKRRLMGLALLGAALFLTTTSASGFGGKRNAPCGTSGDCGSPCATPCGSPCAAPAGTVSYVEKKVMVNEWVAAKEEYKYWVSEPEMKKEKVKFKEMKTKEEPYKYTVNEWVTVKDKVKVADTKATTKDVEYTVVSWTPKVTKQKRTVCEWVCVPVQVTCAAPAPPCGNERGGLFSRLCGKKKHNDCAAPCDPCATPCAAPCPPPVIVKTVMQKQMITKEIEVDVTTYDKVETKAKRPVTTYETVWIDKEIDVKKCMPIEKEGKRTVAFYVDAEKEINVTTWKKIEKTGTRDVMKCVPTEKTVKVAVFTPAPVVVAAPPAPCASPCAPTGMSGDCGSAGRGGLFKGRKGHCCK